MIFFDMDGTICESRQKISPEMKEALQRLKKPFIVISGAANTQMEYQLDGLDCITLSQSGNFNPLWKNALKKYELVEIWVHITKIATELTNYKSSTMIENRGCQVALSCVGHSAPIDKKVAFDPDKKIRAGILKKYPFNSKTLTVRVAGTTCFDYTLKTGTKGCNIARWLKENRLRKKDCVYYGDALFKGGNDETVIGVIRTVKVKNPAHLLTLLDMY